MNTTRPKNPKRTIHIKSQDGRLQSNENELTTIKEHFGRVFSSSEPPVLPEWHLQSPLNISHQEIRQAVRSLSAKKALPKGHAPSSLWKAGEDFVVKVLHSDFSARFGQGKISTPADWHTSFIALIPKPGKPPTSPQNLRPISLLPAIPKLLARIAAQLASVPARSSASYTAVCVHSPSAHIGRHRSGNGALPTNSHKGCGQPTQPLQAWTGSR